MNDIASMRDIRDTNLFKEVEAFFAAVQAVGTGKVTDASDFCRGREGRSLLFAGTSLDRLVGTPSTRLYSLDLQSGGCAALTHGPNSDRLPRLSPNGEVLAYLSDRHEKGVYLPYLRVTGGIGDATPVAVADGTVEDIQWSPDGRKLLISVAGRGAELAAMQGSRTTKAADDAIPPWMPTIEIAAPPNAWRRLLVYDLDTSAISQISPQGLNVWEAAWCGNRQVAAVVADSPSENSWYDARLVLISVADQGVRALCKPEEQAAYPAGSPDGKWLAVVEACCSDRRVVAGDLVLFNCDNGKRYSIDTRNVDVTSLQWISACELIYSGMRDYETVIGRCSPGDSVGCEVFARTGLDGGPWFPTVCPLASDRFVVLVEEFNRPPEIALIEGVSVRTVVSFSHEALHPILASVGRAEPVAWTASDGLEIHGWLVRPQAKPPFPLITDVHGGPVWVARNRWLGRQRHAALLSQRGYAIFYPNPRGSSGRGQAFARMVKGDMGGSDGTDLISGIDSLIEREIADASRIGIIGVSYGGYMASWLITQDQRFAASVPISPATDWYSSHWTSNIPRFDELFLGDTPATRGGGRYYDRSPVMFADRVRTPTLTIVGAADLCTPPDQGVEFHRALLEHGVESVLAIYPQDGHGIRDFPSQIDNTARIISWFERHMPRNRV